jgi:hypothetical protein
VRPLQLAPTKAAVKIRSQKLVPLQGPQQQHETIALQWKEKFRLVRASNLRRSTRHAAAFFQQHN